jgi:capsid protein
MAIKDAMRRVLDDHIRPALESVEEIDNDIFGQLDWTTTERLNFRRLLSVLETIFRSMWP